MLKTRDIPDVEILSVGTWHGTGCPPKGCEFTTDDLDKFAASYRPDFLAPVKLGHTENQKLLQDDGLPAAGWLKNIRRVGEKLMADLSQVPEKIADLIAAGAYKNRSIELHADQVTGLALLGADLPAVENLSDIMSWYSREFQPDEDRIIVFSAPQFESIETRIEKYADNADRVLADVTALLERTGQLVALRANDGRSLSAQHVERLEKLQSGLQDAAKVAGTLIPSKAREPQPPDIKPLVQARQREAQLRIAELTGVPA